ESEPGKGAVFTVWLPVAADVAEPVAVPARPAPAIAPAPAPKSVPGAQILVGDGSEEVREVLRELLSRHGYIVVTSPDGESGLVESETRVFDLAIVDLRLPRLSALAGAPRPQSRL